jgi:3-deoxy-7-phosphoheptulonate synthase
MIIILREGHSTEGEAVARIQTMLEAFPDVRVEARSIRGASRNITEVYLLGETAQIPLHMFELLEPVERVFKVSESYRQIGRHEGKAEPLGWEYKGVRLDQESFEVFLGQCSADTPEYLEQTFKAVRATGVRCSRIGAYKPRTSPYDFQGHGKSCLPWVFDLAGKHGIAMLSMEVCEASHIDDLHAALEAAGHPTGVMLQIGTRNAQNFSLLRAAGRQQEFPVLYKRGHGISLAESLNACEYIASEGNHRIVFCLRGVKTSLGDPHRNFADFTMVPVVKRLTRLPVCVDASHAVGRRTRGSDGLLDIFHASAQGVVAGANMVITETHPEPARALSDGPQALLPSELQHYVQDVQLARTCYEQRLKLASSYS